MDRKAFGSDVKRGASFTDWRKDGKVIFFVHPKSEIEKRITIALRHVVENDDGEEEIKGIRRFYEGDSDITNQFLLWLKNDAVDIEPDDVVFRLKTAGGDDEEYTKGDLLGLQGYDWRKRLLRPRVEYLFNIINVTEKGEKPKGPEVLVLPFSAGKKLNIVWDGEIEELGEEEGDPWINPYASKVTFDANERGSDMYGASTVKRPLTEDVRKLFDEDAVDLSQYTSRDSQDMEHGSTMDLLRAICAVDCPLLDVDVDVEVENRVEEKPKKKKVGKTKARKTKKKSSKQSEDEKVVDKPKAPSKPEPPVKSETKKIINIVNVENAEVGEIYVYNDEELTFVKWDPKKKCGIFKDEDGFKVKVPEGVELEIPGNQVKVEGEPLPEPAKVEGCVSGKRYYTQDGDLLTFVRYNKTKGKGVFSDSEGERCFLDGDELVSEDESESAPDPLAPKAKKEATTQTKPKTKQLEQEDDSDEEMDECPACEKMVAPDANVCPHCGAEFEDEDDDDVPF